MVKEAERRGKKYEAKVDAEVLRQQTTRLKPLMVKGQRDYFPQIVSLEQRIKRLIEAKGVSTLQIRDYLNYGREILDLSKRFGGTTLLAEAQLKTDKWSDRGLDGSTLVEVAQLVGVTPSAMPKPISAWVIDQTIQLEDDALSLNFSNLDLSTCLAYQILMNASLTNRSGLASIIYIFFNDNKTLSSYQTQLSRTSLTSHTTNRLSNPRLASVSAGQPIVAEALVFYVAGSRPRVISVANFDLLTGPSQEHNSIYWLGGVNVTKITLESNEELFTGGSVFSLFKRNVVNA